MVFSSQYYCVIYDSKKYYSCIIIQIHLAIHLSSSFLFSFWSFTIVSSSSSTFYNKSFSKLLMFLLSGSSLLPFGNLPGDRTFCVSPDKMAIAFCILGVIFLCAVVVAACALLKARRTGNGAIPYYTRSLFSSTSGTSAYGGSKLLLQESPCMGQSASSRSLQYGRIL